MAYIMSQLASLEQAFYTGDYESVLAFDLSTLESQEKLHATNLARRAAIVTGHGHDVVEQLGPEDKATKVWADYVLGDLSAVESAKATPKDDVERHFYALTLARAELYSEALDLLKGAGQSLDCAMLATHIHLVVGDVKSAAQVTEAMRKWANDHIVFNLCEAWVALRENGEAAQKAFYIFEEHNGFKTTARSYTGEAVAQLELHRLPEAEESIRRALELGQDEDALATSVALSSAQGKPSDDFTKLQQLQHSQIVKDIKEKDELFDKIVQKYVI